MFTSKYDSLWKHLKADGGIILRLSFEEMKNPAFQSNPSLDLI